MKWDLGWVWGTLGCAPGVCGLAQSLPLTPASLRFAVLEAPRTPLNQSPAGAGVPQRGRAQGSEDRPGPLRGSCEGDWELRLTVRSLYENLGGHGSTPTGAQARG